MKNFLFKMVTYFKRKSYGCFGTKSPTKCYTGLFSNASQHRNMVKAHTDVTRIFVLC